MDWLLRRLADRLGVEPARAGEAITPQIRFERAWSQGVTILVIVACAALIVYLYRREGSASMRYKMLLATLRITLVVLAVFMLSEAVLSVERTGLPYFVVMADDSASSSEADQYADPAEKAAAETLAKVAGKTVPSRFAVAQGWLARDDGRILRALQRQHKVRLYLVSSTAQELAEIDKPEDVAPAVTKLLKAEPEGKISRLGDGVRRVLTELRGAPPSAILFLTDGQTTEGEGLAKAAEFTRGKGVPLFTIGLGDPQQERDLELTDLQVDDVVFVDDQVPFRFTIGGRGYAGQDVKVRLLELPPGSQDPTAGKEIVSRREKVPPDGQPKTIEIGHRPKEVGDRTFVIDVDVLPRERRTDNNRLVRTIHIRKEKLKVLIVEGYPRYEYRYLKNFLERDETIELGVVLQSADPEYSEQDLYALPTFPASKDDLFKYDVVILGDADPSFLSASQMGNLREFVVEKGGGILFVAGENFNPLAYKGTPLEPLLPIQLAEARNPTAVGNAIASFRPRLTAEGRTSPIFRFADNEADSLQVWDNLPELFWFLEAPRKQPAAFVLAEHPTVRGADNAPLPLVLYQFVGAGKAMFSAVDDTWRWRFRVADRYFGRYWIQGLRFLARSKLAGQKQAEVSTDRSSYQPDQPVQVRVRFPNPGLAPAGGEVNVEVERQGRGPRKLALKTAAGSKSIFEGVLPRPEVGSYEVRLLPPPVLEGGLPSARFKVEPPADEFVHLRMNEPELRQAAEASGGKFYTPATASLATLLKDLPPPQKVPLDTDPPIPLWNAWPVLALFLIVVTAEWVLRKRKQMV